MAAFDNSLADATDPFARIRDPEEMQFDRVALFLRALENVHVRSATQRGFERERFMPIRLIRAARSAEVYQL